MDDVRKPLKVFVSYSRKDRRYLEPLNAHLAPIQQSGDIEIWDDRQIEPGKEWDAEIAKRLREADIILFLVSNAFIHSYYCYRVEVKQAIERVGSARVIPIILEHCLWDVTVFAKLQALPSNRKPVRGGGWNNQTNAFHNIAEGIHTVVKQWKPPSPASKTPPAPPEPAKANLTPNVVLLPPVEPPQSSTIPPGPTRPQTVPTIIVPSAPRPRSLPQSPNSLDMVFVRIEPGTFTMGSNEEEREKPPHKVTISRPFSLGVYPVTRAEYLTVTGNDPSYFKGADDLPVERVSWFDAITFCNRFSEREGRQPYYNIEKKNVQILGGNGFRLPTEAEWEYACRAGTSTRYPFGDDESELKEYAWYEANSEDRTHSVGLREPNQWGLHDMLGNVWEWVQDGYDPEYYQESPTVDPPGPYGSARVFRGGGWSNSAEYCRAAFRSGSTPTGSNHALGLRLARVP